jgi:hypothetical protein
MSRVFDLKSKYSFRNNSFGIPFGNSIMCEIDSTSSLKEDGVQLNTICLFGLGTRRLVSLHRLVAIVAEEKGLSIFHEGVLGDLGVVTFFLNSNT